MPLERRQTAGDVARARLDEICHRTNTYIKTPDNDSPNIYVWGAPEDVGRALQELDTFESDTRQTGPRPSRANWTKTKAHDGRVEDRAYRNLRARDEAAVRLANNKQARFEFQAFLLWPEKVDMKRFRSKYEDTTLLQIQGKSPCSIDFVDTTVKYVKISAQEERDVHRIYARVINLVKETVAQDGLFSRINRFRLPRSSLYRSKVGLDKDPNSDVMIPTLHGDLLPQSEEPEWELLCRKADASDSAMLRTEMESIIKAMQAPGQQVRMRVVFTELGFKRIERPPEGQDFHHFDDFCQMLGKQQTELSMVGLRNNSGNMGDLVDILAAMPEFNQPEIRYLLHFDFVGDNNATLRHEREMYSGLNGELEDEAMRWMLFSHAYNEYEVLEYNMLDFEHLRSNYQVRIGKTPIHEHEHQKKEYETFQNNLAYVADPLGMRAEPRRRAIFPPGRNELVKHEEVTVARFNFRGPDARFELLRKDIFDETGRQSSSKPSRTLWYAQYYYPEWDSLLSEFGNLKPGEVVSWPRRMETFFRPEYADDDTRALPKGFKSFVREIEHIQGLLQKALEELDTRGSGEPNGELNGLANGVDGMEIG